MRARSAAAGLLLLVLFAMMSQAEDVKRDTVRRPSVGCFYDGRWYSTGQVVEKVGHSCTCLSGTFGCEKVSSNSIRIQMCHLLHLCLVIVAVFYVCKDGASPRY